MTQKLSSTLKSANVKHLIDKAKSGKTLTKAELMLVEEYEEQQESLSRSDYDTRLIFNAFDLCNIFGVTNKTISAWAREGMPRVSHGKFALKAVLKWWLDKHSASGHGRDETITEAKRRYWSAKAEQAQRENEIQEGKVVHIDSVITANSRILQMLKSKCLSLATRLPPLLEGLETAEQIPVIAAEVKTILKAAHDDMATTTPKKKSRTKTKK